jgi:hypothetical protein
MRGKLLTLLVVLALVPLAVAQTHPTGVPAQSSKPGAAYTIYLDFAGFSFTGTWGGSGSPSGTPGVTPAYDGQTTAFTATEIANMNNVWARVAEKYSSFNVNVTTVDPAVAAGKADTDAHRQQYYDNTAQLMHTVIGGNGSWSGGGGVSFVGTTKNSYPTTNNSVDNNGAGAGFHTNWQFNVGNETALQFIAEASAHENGHGLGLSHQSDYNGNALVNEYSSGSGTGTGSFAPIMGNSYTAQRGTWRLGTAHVNNTGPTNQNDPGVIATNPNIGAFVDDNVGHTRPTATALPFSGTNINAAAAKGVISPASAATPNPIGVNNYTNDFWSFSTGTTSNVQVLLNSGGERLTAGTADPGAMFDGTITLLDSNGNPTGISGTTHSTASLQGGFSLTNVPAGTYFLQIQSFGGETNSAGANITATNYFDMGSYFLTGNITAVPEPTSLLLTAGGFGVLAWSRRRKARAA